MSTRQNGRHEISGIIVAAEYQKRQALEAAKEQAELFTHMLSQAIIENNGLSLEVVTGCQDYIPLPWKTAEVKFHQQTVGAIDIAKAQLANATSEWMVVLMPRVSSREHGDFRFCLSLHRDLKRARIDVYPEQTVLL